MSYNKHLTMVDLRTFYDQRVRNLGSQQLLAQVGHTVGGEPISKDEFKRLTSEVVGLLDLSKSDVLLDLGCGNGLITKELAGHCDYICAVDFSDEMINSAMGLNSAVNIRYVCSNILNSNDWGTSERKFSKVLMYGALQHFDKDDLDRLLRQILPLCQTEVSFIFGFVPNREKRWGFYDSFDRRLRYLLNRLLRRDIMGTWWSKKWISQRGEKMGFSCRFVDVAQGRYGHPYRFHAVLQRSEVDGT